MRSNSQTTSDTHPQHLQLLETLLHQLLHFARVALHASLPECIYCPSPSVLAEVVCGELLALAQKRTEERAGLVGRGGGGHLWVTVCAFYAGYSKVAWYLVPEEICSVGN
jgi:hypothetical protein